MLEVGLTGGIACGKTTVRKRFESKGVPTRDADAIVHELFREDAALIAAIRSRFGDDVVRESGEVDRKALGATVFADDGARSDLEALVHPRVYAAIDEFFAAAEGAGERVAVVDAALMVETGSYRRYDRLVVVACPREVQEKRLMERDGLSLEDARRRIDAQMPVEEKKAFADYVIDTSGSIEETLSRADEVLERLLRGAEVG